MGSLLRSSMNSVIIFGFNDAHKFLCSKLSPPCKFGVIAFASRKSVKKLSGGGKTSPNVSIGTGKRLSEESTEAADGSARKNGGVNDGNSLQSFKDSAAQNSISMPSRDNVLQACTVTSGLMAALGLIIRQVSHVASEEGLPVPDCSVEVSFGFEIWHLQLTIGLVVLISSFRYLLLKSWPDFAESSEAANRQVLTALQPSDYLIVAFLPGISEELLFRGALLPLFGFDWKSILVVSIIFGVLHLGSGRKYSFAVWATLVGLAYGYATVISSSLSVPVASHALNNLVGGVLWRYTSKSLKTADHRKRAIKKA